MCVTNAHWIDTDHDRRIGDGSLGPRLNWFQFANFRNFFPGALWRGFGASLVASDRLGQRELLLLGHDRTQKAMNEHVMH